MTYRTLGKTGLRVSLLGFGAATLGNEYGATEPGEGTRAVHCAIDNGINFFDVAPYYGRTLAESRLGEALKGRRHSIVLATKCGRFDTDCFDFSAARVTQSVEESLSRLQTDYVDILHIHDIEFAERRQIIEETIPALRKVQASGKAKWIGITGLPLTILREVAEAAPVDCILSYCRYNIMNTDLQDLLIPFAVEKRIGVINASPLHMRLLTNAGPPDWHPASPQMRRAGRFVVELCQSRGVSVTDVALQFATRYEHVASTLTGISTEAEVYANIRAIESRTDPTLLAEIEEVVAPIRGKMWQSGLGENQDSRMLF
jgi:L-galactose dehydrogenase